MHHQIVYVPCVCFICLLKVAVVQRVERWTCDEKVVVQILHGAKLCNNLGQVVHTYLPLSPNSITWGIAHRRKPPLMRSRMARVRGITQFYLPPTRLSTNGMNHPAFTP